MSARKFIASAMRCFEARTLQSVLGIQTPRIPELQARSVESSGRSPAPIATANRCFSEDTSRRTSDGENGLYGMKEGRRKKEEGRRKKEEGIGKKEEGEF
ncbi:MAG: hypothetical protein HC942_22400 [Microcoleus sp. SU_5_6]|nr:hypothetical protein [Microcoleus sp. SU_5_6]